MLAWNQYGISFKTNKVIGYLNQKTQILKISKAPMSAPSIYVNLSAEATPSAYGEFHFTSYMMTADEARVCIFQAVLGIQPCPAVDLIVPLS